MFWFPLRQKKSELSEVVYTPDRLEQLIQALKNEISTVLLFLNHLQTIEVYTSVGTTAAPRLEFSVEVYDHCSEDFEERRERFMSDIATIPHKAVGTTFLHVAQVCLNE